MTTQAVDARIGAQTARADLKQWDTVSIGTSANESVLFSDTAPPGTARRFYCVVKE